MQKNIPTSLGTASDKPKGVKAPNRLTRSERLRMVRRELTVLSLEWQAKNKRNQ